MGEPIYSLPNFKILRATLLLNSVNFVNRRVNHVLRGSVSHDIVVPLNTSTTKTHCSFFRKVTTTLQPVDVAVAKLMTYLLLKTHSCPSGF
jgi:hypothetical protein